MSKDEIYASHPGDGRPFEFNEAVASVFPDMLRRSIPGYGASIEAIGWLAARCIRANTRCYDLGSSLGAAALAVRDKVSAAGVRIIAVDNAPAMAERLRQRIAAEPGPGATRQPTPEITVMEADVRDVEIAEASMVVMNYALQFLPVGERNAMVAKVFRGLIEGGIFFLSEKVVNEDPAIEALAVDLHHDHKRANAYSELEISRKRAALENVLVPETLGAHRERLSGAGFRHVGVLLRHFNFVSLLAIR